MRHNIFPDILSKTVYGILFILTQNVYLYTPAFLYAPFIPIFFLFPPVYKKFLCFTQCGLERMSFTCSQKQEF